MEINFDIYQRLEQFSLAEAAALWIGVQPGSANPNLEATEKLLNKTLVNIELKAHQKYGVWEAYDRVFTLIAFNQGTHKNISHFSMKYDSNTGILKASPDDIAKINVSDKDYRFTFISRSDLIRIAETLDMKPDFLYPEAKNLGWDKGGISKESYQELVISCFKSMGVCDINDPTAVRKIMEKLELVGHDTSERTIREILNEIDPTRKRKGHNKNNSASPHIKR